MHKCVDTEKKERCRLETRAGTTGAAGTEKNQRCVGLMGKTKAKTKLSFIQQICIEYQPGVR